MLHIYRNIWHNCRILIEWNHFVRRKTVADRKDENLSTHKIHTHTNIYTAYRGNAQWSERTGWCTVLGQLSL